MNCRKPYLHQSVIFVVLSSFGNKLRRSSISNYLISSDRYIRRISITDTSIIPFNSKAYVNYVLGREHSLTLQGEVSLYGWPPVWLLWIQLLCLCIIYNRFACLAKSKPVKQEVSCTVILPLRFGSYNALSSEIGHGGRLHSEKLTIWQLTIDY